LLGSDAPGYSFTGKKTGSLPKTYALLALMCFHTARFNSRLNDAGSIVVLEEQDRTLWDKELIERGFSFLSNASQAMKSVSII